MATLGIAGLMSAKTMEENTIKKKESLNSKEVIKVFLLREYDWVKVTTSCGKVFYLDNNMYGDCYECLQEDARYFTDAKCGSGSSFEVPF